MTTQDILVIVVGILLIDNHFMRRAVEKLRCEMKTEQNNIETLWDAVQPEAFLDDSDPTRMIPIPSHLSMPV